MKRSPHGPRFRPADLRDPDAAHDALVHWDEQDEQILRLLAASPEHGGRLDTLQRADSWLRQRAAETIDRRNEDGGTAGPGPASHECPSAEDLYDFGGGPGARELDPKLRASIDRHMAECLACERLIESLELPPPVPLVYGEKRDARRRPAVVRLRRVAGVALAAAAGLALAFGAWRMWGADTHAAWPTEPLLRGDGGAALVHPRDKVLERSDALAALSAAWRGGLEFELLAPPPGGARFELFRTGGGAFDEPELVANWESSAERTRAPRALTSGYYTWKAWTREHGLELELGSRDFEVARDEALERELASLLESGGDRAAVRAVRLLHDRGWKSDARALARTLPASPERDAYLGRPPGR